MTVGGQPPDSSITRLAVAAVALTGLEVAPRAEALRAEADIAVRLRAWYLRVRCHGSMKAVHVSAWAVPAIPSSPTPHGGRTPALTCRSPAW
jgi:hypothetical protein